MVNISLIPLFLVAVHSKWTMAPKEQLDLKDVTVGSAEQQKAQREADLTGYQRLINEQQHARDLINEQGSRTIANSETMYFGPISNSSGIGKILLGFLIATLVLVLIGGAGYFVYKNYF